MLLIVLNGIEMRYSRSRTILSILLIVLNGIEISTDEYGQKPRYSLLIVLNGIEIRGEGAHALPPYPFNRTKWN